MEFEDAYEDAFGELSRYQWFVDSSPAARIEFAKQRANRMMEQAPQEDQPYEGMGFGEMIEQAGSGIAGATSAIGDFMGISDKARQEKAAEKKAKADAFTARVEAGKRAAAKKKFDFQNQLPIDERLRLRKLEIIKNGGLQGLRPVQ